MQTDCRSVLFPGLGLLFRVVISHACATLSHLHAHNSVAPCATADATGCGGAARNAIFPYCVTSLLDQQLKSLEPKVLMASGLTPSELLHR